MARQARIGMVGRCLEWRGKAGKNKDSKHGRSRTKISAKAARVIAGNGGGTSRGECFDMVQMGERQNTRPNGCNKTISFNKSQSNESITCSVD